jgi:GNAT superfamily N-acetyltransferase
MEQRDIERVAALTTQLGYASTSEDVARRFAHIDGSPDQIVLVAEEGGAAIGWLHMAIHPYLEHDASAEILGLVVADGHRSRGVGEALVADAEAWARERHCPAVRVRSRVTRERAHSFYERHGYAREKTQHCFQKRIA